ncbi:MAG: hypothetical protein IE918_04115 [Campylobacterales bacterium]|nr:hypothetical protein [Campylobacterales bacterium]
MGKVIQLITKGATEQVSTVEAGAGRVANTLIIKAQPGVKYELRDAATKFAPQQLLVIRQGKDLWIKLEDGEEDELNTTDAPDIIIENYYEDASGSLIGLSEDGEYYDYAPQEGTSDLYASNMDDGEFSYQSLGYADLPGETNWVPLILGALWLGGLALASNDDDTKAPDVFNPPEAPDAPDMTDDTDTGASNTDNNTADSTPDFEIAPPAEGETPNLYIDGELVPSTFDPVNNIITPVDPLPDGPHTVTVTVTDSHGESPQSPGLDIIIDTTPPALTALLDPASDSGVVGDGITNDTTPTISGTGEEGAAIRVVINGETLTTTVDSGGNWSVTPTVPLDDGSYTAAVSETDIAGNTTTADVPVVIDTTVNTVSIEGIDEDTDTAGDFITTDGDGLTVYASLSSTLAADEQLWCSNDNGATWIDISSFVSGTDVSYHDDALTSTTTVMMKVEDTAGNSAEDSQLITINTVPGAPTTTVDINSITVDSGIVGDFITNDNDGLMIGATLSAPLAAGETLWYRTDGGAWIDITGSIDVDNITVNYYDSSLTSTDVVQMKVVNGTGDGPTASQLVTIDTTAPLAPTVAITEDINNDGYINAGELSGNVDVRIILPSGTVEGDTVNVTDGTTPQTFVLTGTDITNGYIDTSFASPGEGNTITVSATVTDIAGNTGPSGSDSAVLETAAPAVINATANVSEEGLPGAVSDMTGTPTDTTNAATVSGTISISDASGVSLVAVSGPAGLTSGGVAVTWSGSFAGGV